MRVLYLITSLRVGGAEVVTVNLANEVAKMGHKVMILYLTGKNLHKEKMHGEIEVYSLDVKKDPISFMKSLLVAKGYIKEFVPDIVHGQMFHANMFSRILRVFCHLNVLVCTEHSKDVRGKGRMILYRLTDFLSDINTNVSEEATEHFINEKAFSARKSYAMYNGIYLDKFKRNVEKRNIVRNKYRIGPECFLFLNVGRLTAAKDQKNLLLAFSRLISKGYTPKLMIVGGGELETELQDMINSLELNDFVTLAGIHENIEDYYSAADCFVLSSAWEGLPTCIIEAKASSLPVITTIAGRELVEENYVVPIKDAQALSLKMEELMLSPTEKLKEIGYSNYLASKAFDICDIAHRWVEIYSTSQK